MDVHGCMDSTVIMSLDGDKQIYKTLVDFGSVDSSALV